MKYNSNLLNKLSQFTCADYVRTDSTDTNQEIFPNQIEASIDIVKSMTGYILPEDEFTYRNRHILLMAQMQSGKTGTISGVINVLKKTGFDNYFNINKYFIITGMNDSGLHEQTYKRIELQSFDASDETVDSGSKDGCKGENCEFIVHKNFDLRSSGYKLENCIVFVDESHYGSSKNAVLTQFFNKSGINWKNGKELRDKNIFIISVSATSFDEIYSDLDDSKIKVTLYPTESYVGVVDFDDLDLLNEASINDFKINKETMVSPIEEYLKDAYDRMNQDEVKGICFIRAQGRKAKVISNSVIVNNLFNVVELDAKNGKVDYTRVRKEVLAMYSTYSVEKPVVFLIKGSYRAGISLDEGFKDITYLVHDFSLETHATPQGLLGRMCGYRKNPECVSRTKFYVHYESATQYSNWVREDFHKEGTPSKLKWVSHEKLTGDEIGKINPKKDSRIMSKSIGPEHIILTNDEVNEIKTIHGEITNANQKRDWLSNFIKSKGFNFDFQYFGEYFLKGTYDDTVQDRWINTNGGSLRPDKSNFGVINDGRMLFQKEDVMSKFIHVILDEPNNDLIVHRGFLDLEYRQKNTEKMYKEHKDTSKASL